MSPLRFFFFFNDTATTEIYTLSLHDALPISSVGGRAARRHAAQGVRLDEGEDLAEPVQRDGLAHEVGDRKSTRLNSSHSQISYAVFCLKKKKITSDAWAGRMSHHPRVAHNAP